MQTFEHIIITAKDGAEIPAITYNVEDGSKKGVIVVCHGFGEHSGSYIEHAERLWQGGYASIIPDQRGHGKPPDGVKKWHGLIPDYQCFIDDIVSVTETVKEMAPGVPIALYGHSMGGNIVINTLLRLPPEQVSTYFCAVLESPWLELYKPLNPPMICLLRFLNRIVPDFTVFRKLKHSDLSSDEEKRGGYSKDPYYHGLISMRMITGVIDACSYALANAARMPVKSFMAYADNDLVVSTKAMLDFAAKAGDIITVKEYASNHAIYNDVKRESYCRDLISFLDSNI